MGNLLTFFAAFTAGLTLASPAVSFSAQQILDCPDADELTAGMPRTEAPGTSPPPPDGEPPSPATPPPRLEDLDLERIADEVYALVEQRIVRQLTIDRESVGE